MICHNCGETNHIPSLCRSERNQARGTSKHVSQSSFKWEHKHNFVSDVQPEECNDDSLDVVALNLKPVPSVNPCSSNKITRLSSLIAYPITLEVNMERQNVVKEVDTGASVSVCNQDF